MNILKFNLYYIKINEQFKIKLKFKQIRCKGLRSRPFKRGACVHAQHTIQFINPTDNLERKLAPKVLAGVSRLAMSD